MAQVYNCRLTRGDPSCSWGFRLQGGKDFGTPLLIQKVNIGSLAERAGLQVGDAVLRVNNKDVSNEKHKDAQDIIIRAGNSFEITVQRGGLGTWRPMVTPVGSIPSPNSCTSLSPTPVTKTSLMAADNNRVPSPRIPHGFNSSMKPFSPHPNGVTENGNGPVKAIVNKQYNSPVGIYSDESIAETLSAQAEVLAGGVLGVNFKKNEKDYNSEASEVFKMVQEAEKDSRTPEPGYTDTNGVSSPVAGLRHVSPPKTTYSTPSSEPSLTPGKNICADCERLIVGVFVRIKDKNLHVECFKCATCGTSLKNVGYYSINNKLYCDVHAKMIAKQHPPAPNLEPHTVSPHQNAATNKPFKSLSPQPPSLAPALFHNPRLSPTRAISPSLQNQNTVSFNGTKPFTPSQSSNTSSAFRPGFHHTPLPKPFLGDIDPKPLISAGNASSTQYSSYFNSMPQRLPFLKPKAEKTSAFMPVMKSTTNTRTTVYNLSSTIPTVAIDTLEKTTSCVDTSSDSRLETVLENSNNGDSCEKRLSVCSQEISRVLTENKYIRNLTALVDQTRPESPAPSESADEFSTFEYNKQSVCEKRKAELTFDRPRSVRSISPANRPATPGQVVTYPPPLPESFHKVRTTPPISCAPGLQTVEKTDTKIVTDQPKKEHTEELISLRKSPPLKFEPGIITTLLTTAPTRPFTPIEPVKATIFTEAVPLPRETIPYQPESDMNNRPIPRAPSPLVAALTVGSARSYSPLPTSTDYHEFLDKPPQDTPVARAPTRPSMAEALSIAPVRAYSTSDDNKFENLEENRTTNNIPDLSEDPSLILTRPSLDPIVKKDPPMTYSSLYTRDAFFPPITEELRAKFEEKKRKSGSHSSRKSIEYSSPDINLDECSRSTKTMFCSDEKTPTQVPLCRVTDTGLHKPVGLPHYQHCVKELTAKNAKKTPSSSRYSTPMQSDRPTPVNFDATVTSPQQRIFNSEVTNKLESRHLTSFLTQTVDISEKVPPALGYQPCPMIERAAFEKIEKCVQNIRDSRMVERPSVSPALQRPSSVISIPCSESGSCKSAQKLSKEKPKRRTRSRTGRSPDRPSSSVNIRPSPLALPSCSTADPGSNNNPIIVTASGAQCFRPPPSPTTVLSDNKRSSPAAVSLLSRQLSKTMSALTTANNVSNLACSNRNLSNITSNFPNANPQAGGTVGDNSSSKLSNGGTAAGFSAPRRGKGVWNQQNLTPGARIPLCAHCNAQIRGPFVTALGKIWCPEHFVCVNNKCGRSLLDIGFVEEPTGLYCEYCFEQYLAPQCGKCNQKIKGDCLNGIGKHFHPECFTCAYCGKKFGNNPFFLEEGLPYCENDWNELFTTKCFACGFPIEAGDRWVEALNNNYHSPCFNCTICKTNLEGQSFYAKGGRPFCKTHSR